MNNTFNARNSTRAAKINLQIKDSILIFILSLFVLISLVQAFELGDMLSDARSIGSDIASIRTGREIILEQHSFYSND